MSSAKGRLFSLGLNDLINELGECKWIGTKQMFNQIGKHTFMEISRSPISLMGTLRLTRH